MFSAPLSAAFEHPQGFSSVLGSREEGRRLWQCASGLDICTIPHIIANVKDFMRTGTNVRRPEAKRRPRAYDPDVALDQAMRVFWEAGYASSSLDDLGAAMAMSRPSLYGAFGDKEALY